MKKAIQFLICQLWFTLMVGGQTQRALVIGIDQYTPPAGYKPSTTSGRIRYENLDGCKNDALAIRSLLNSRFDFDAKNIDTLFDASASRDGILTGMNQLLLNSSAGDIAFIYYAGHGSEVNNSLSFEADKKDQTIVPSNTWQEGIPDIRDKELAKIFNDFIDKNIRLTVIFDCCHSGSISRGPNDPRNKVRFMPMSNWDSKDAARYPVPEKRAGKNFLIFSAAQSNELAAEDEDEQEAAHGAFTLCLLNAINQQSVNASALDIFIAARAILKSRGKSQEPVIGGSEERQQETLFGIKKGKLTDWATISVSGVNGSQVELQGGFAIGLYKENTLARLGGNNDTLFALRVDTVLGVDKSLASVIKGNSNEIKPGNQFRVTNWVSSGRPLLHVYVPRASLSATEVANFVNVANQLKKSARIKWLDRVGKGIADPYATVFWVNAKCFIKIDRAAAKEIRNISAQSILQECKTDSTLYVEIPISKEDADNYYSSLARNKNLLLVNDPRKAHYLLFARLGLNGLPAVGLRKTEVASRDSLESMPMTTDCFEIPTGTPLAKNIGDSLLDRAMRLSKLKGWLNLEVPDATRAGFGFHLELMNESTRQNITNGKYRIGDQFEMKLIADSGYTPEAFPSKYVYVFAIDQSGRMQLLFPGSDGNVINHFPQFDNNKLVKEISLSTGNRVSAPTGTDNYFLLACDEPISAATRIFNQDGVDSGAVSRSGTGDNSLTLLLLMGNTQSRGNQQALPANWNLRKYAFTCTY